MKILQNIIGLIWVEMQIFFRPENEKQLIQFIKTIHNLQINFHILGAGSNTLIRDRGIRGSVIKLGSKFASIKLIEEDKIEVGAGILDKKVSDFAKEYDRRFRIFILYSWFNRRSCNNE